MRVNKAAGIRINDIPEGQMRSSTRDIKETTNLLYSEVGTLQEEVKVLQGWPPSTKLEFATDATLKVPHGLSGTPTDIYLTWIEWESVVGVFAFDYSKFDKTDIYYTCSQPAKLVRAIVGRRG